MNKWADEIGRFRFGRLCVFRAATGEVCVRRRRSHSTGHEFLTVEDCNEGHVLPQANCYCCYMNGRIIATETEI